MEVLRSSEKVALNQVESGEKLSRRHLGELTGSIRPIRASTLATQLGSKCENVLLQGMKGSLKREILSVIRIERGETVKRWLGDTWQ